MSFFKTVPFYLAMGTMETKERIKHMEISFNHLENSCDSSDSCLAEKLSRLDTLSPQDRAEIVKLEDSKETMRAGHVLLGQGQDVDNFYIVKKGWVISSIKNAGGSRTVIDIHHPGDIVGISQMPFAKSPFSCTAATNSIVCPFPRKNLEDLLRDVPRVAGMVQAVGMIEQAILYDRISKMSREEAHIRLCHFVLQTFCRLRFMNNDLTDRFYCPLNQATIGDAIGVTGVHVSRMFAKLSEMGLIERNGSFIRFIDWDSAVEMTEFVDRYLQTSLPWLPGNT